MLSKIMRNIFFLLLLNVVWSSHVWGQVVEKESKNKKGKKFDASSAVLIAPNYTAQFPYGNMKDRFGFNSLFGMQISYKTDRNWLIGGEAAFLYGSNVKESYVPTKIATTTNQYISQNNDLIRINPQEQGFNVKLIAGKIIPFHKKFPDAGLLTMTSFGFLYHKIALNVREASLPQLSKVYRQGYDRMSYGPVISQFIGGVFMMRKKYASGYIGATFDIAFTQGHRAYDFYSMAPLHDKRIDMFVGLKVGWIIPVFLQTTEKEFYYY